MRVFRHFEYRLSKAENAGVLFERARGVVTHLSPHEPQVLFTLGDQSIGAKVSAVDRAIKRFPELKPFERDPSAVGPFTQGARSLSNADGMAGVSLDTLQAIAEGVPRSYPFAYASFVFLGVDWFRTGAPPVPLAEEMASPSQALAVGPLASSIVFASNWWVNGRQVMILATVEETAPANDVPHLPDLPADVRASLERLGKIKIERFVAIASEEETAFLASVAEEAKRAAIEARAAVDDVPMPFELPPPPENVLAEPRQSASPKDALTAAFKPLGYKYQSKLSGQGSYTLTKRSASHNQMQVHFDAGTWSGRLTGFFLYRGPLWKQSVTLRFAPGVHEFNWHASGMEGLGKACKNPAAIVAYLEKTLVPALDAIYGPGPAWFEYQD